MVRDVSQADFERDVIERSREVPVVVDFWAEWCGPCRRLGPALERAAGDREGKVDLAKVDVDSNQGLAQAFRVQSIPAVKAFKDGKMVAEFTGAIPPAQIERFFDELVPSEAAQQADAALESGDEADLRAALEADPRNASVARALGRLLLARGDADAAIEVLEPHEHDFTAAGLAARARLSRDDGGLEAAFAAWDGDDRAAALESLQEAFAGVDEDAREDIRKVMVAIFTELGPGDPLAREHRRRFSAAMY
ncbi:MAG TPA: thioredoxin [Thermoleophilaceae bacterium]|jgi:putative thioredoxin